MVFQVTPAKKLTAKRICFMAIVVVILASDGLCLPITV